MDRREEISGWTTLLYPNAKSLGGASQEKQFFPFCVGRIKPCADPARERCIADHAGTARSSFRPTLFPSRRLVNATRTGPRTCPVRRPFSRAYRSCHQQFDAEYRPPDQSGFHRFRRLPSHSSDSHLWHCWTSPTGRWASLLFFQRFPPAAASRSPSFEMASVHTAEVCEPRSIGLALGSFGLSQRRTRPDSPPDAIRLTPGLGLKAIARAPLS